MKITYKKIQDYIVEPLPLVEVLREKIIFHAFEVESVTDLGNGDYELDIKVLPDRAHDAKEDRGMAREVAALFNLNLKEPDVYEKTASVVFSIAKVSALLGRAVTEDEIKKVFNAYHYQYDIAGDTVTLFVPPWRIDITNVYDVCDELGRYLGYDTIPAVLPNLGANNVHHTPEYLAIMNKKQEMIEKGYNEVMTYSLTKKGDYQVAKGPKGKDFLRTDLLTGLRVAYALNKQNEALLPNNKANIFEIGKVFKKTGEELHVAWIDNKGEHEEVLDITNVGNGELATIGSSDNTEFKMWSEYPFITRDFALWVPEAVSADEIIGIINQHKGDLVVRGPELFDTFTKDNRTSYAFRIIFQAPDRTLTDADVQPVTDAIYAALKAIPDSEIR